MVAYSLDLRTRVLKASDAGMASKLVAEKYAVSRAWVDRLKQRRREPGEIAPPPPDAVADAAPARAVAAARDPDPGATGSDAGGVAAGVADVGEPPDDLASGHEARLPA